MVQFHVLHCSVHFFPSFFCHLLFLSSPFALYFLVLHSFLLSFVLFCRYYCLQCTDIEYLRLSALCIYIEIQLSGAALSLGPEQTALKVYDYIIIVDKLYSEFSPVNSQESFLQMDDFLLDISPFYLYRKHFS